MHISPYALTPPSVLVGSHENSYFCLYLSLVPATDGVSAGARKANNIIAAAVKQLTRKSESYVLLT